jgi:hypothetical protein
LYRDGFDKKGFGIVKEIKPYLVENNDSRYQPPQPVRV